MRSCYLLFVNCDTDRSVCALTHLHVHTHAYTLHTRKKQLQGREGEKVTEVGKEGWRGHPILWWQELATGLPHSSLRVRARSRKWLQQWGGTLRTHSWCCLCLPAGSFVPQSLTASKNSSWEPSIKSRSLWAHSICKPQQETGKSMKPEEY